MFGTESGCCPTYTWWWLPDLAKQLLHSLGPCPSPRRKTWVATTRMGRGNFTISCECKNYMETPRRSQWKNGVFQVAIQLTLPINGIWIRSLHSLRSQEVRLLHIRPLTASLMMTCLHVLQVYKVSMLGMQRNFCKEKPQTHWSPKRGDKRKEESRWFQVEEDRDTNVFYVWFASRHYSGWIYTAFPDPVSLGEILRRI